MKRILRRVLVFAFILSMILCESACGGNKKNGKGSASTASESKTEYNRQEESSQSITHTVDVKGIKVSDISAERISSASLDVKWSFSDDFIVEEYDVKRRCEKDNDPQWIKVGSVLPDGSGSYSYSDKVDDTLPAQYSYRIDIVPKDKDTYRGEQGSTCVISNILVCIDPGHFLGAGHLEGENIYGYEESVVTLGIGLALSKILREEYGITSYMTRTSDNIKINGYANGDLDHHHLSLRGEYSAGSDLFVSLHTNANLNDANGYPTTSQPVSINKPIILANTIACRSKEVISMCNEIGNEITRVYSDMKLYTASQFEAASVGKIKTWSDDYNDSLDVPGTVCKRIDNDGDYYGVLKGAAKVGVPGIIIEHGYHTVAEVRYAAMKSDLITRLAKADASGIAAYVR